MLDIKDGVSFNVYKLSAFLHRGTAVSLQSDEQARMRTYLYMEWFH